MNLNNRVLDLLRRRPDRLYSRSQIASELDLPPSQRGTLRNSLEDLQRRGLIRQTRRGYGLARISRQKSERDGEAARYSRESDRGRHGRGLSAPPRAADRTLRSGGVRNPSTPPGPGLLKKDPPSHQDVGKRSKPSKDNGVLRGTFHPARGGFGFITPEKGDFGGDLYVPRDWTDQAEVTLAVASDGDALLLDFERLLELSELLEKI